MSDIDLTPFGFTPTESRVYQVLLEGGPGTGYSIAQTAGLARANTYSALEGLVTKGAALVDGDRPKRYRPESPNALMARITNRQGHELERLNRALAEFGAPDTPTLVDIDSPRGALQIITHEVARARTSVALLLPADAFPILSPTLRRAVSANLATRLFATAPVQLGFADVRVVEAQGWPGEPLVAVIDGRSAVIGSRNGPEVRGHWSTSPSFVASAERTLNSWGSR
jgi:HTH-type transcriptional regulator, sugar sensing transcriptional regulator